MSFKAFRIHQQEKGVRAGFEQMEVSDLTEGDVVVRVAYSGINFKDALAASGKAKILRVPDLNGGIDFSGTVESSESDRFKPGDRVASNGNHAGVVSVPRHLCARIPDGVSYEQAAFATIGAIALHGVRLARPPRRRLAADEGQKVGARGVARTHPACWLRGRLRSDASSPA